MSSCRPGDRGSAGNQTGRQGGYQQTGFPGPGQDYGGGAGYGGQGYNQYTQPGHDQYGAGMGGQQMGGTSHMSASRPGAHPGGHMGGGGAPHGSHGATNPSRGASGVPARQPVRFNKMIVYSTRIVIGPSCCCCGY